MSDIIYDTGTQEKPLIYFDNSYQLRIAGCSFPENSWDVYRQVMRRLSELIEKRPGTLTCEFTLTYCNKSSISCIKDLFKLMGVMQHCGWKIYVKWNYQQLDEDIKCAGEELSKILDENFELVECEDAMA